MSLDVIARQLWFVGATILFVGAFVYATLNKIADALGRIAAALEDLSEEINEELDTVVKAPEQLLTTDDTVAMQLERQANDPKYQEMLRKTLL